jgi:hypothetical protein
MIPSTGERPPQPATRGVWPVLAIIGLGLAVLAVTSPRCDEDGTCVERCMRANATDPGDRDTHRSCEAFCRDLAATLDARQ